MKALQRLHHIYIWNMVFGSIPRHCSIAVHIRNLAIHCRIRSLMSSASCKSNLALDVISPLALIDTKAWSSFLPGTAVFGHSLNSFVNIGLAATSTAKAVDGADRQVSPVLTARSNILHSKFLPEECIPQSIASSIEATDTPAATSNTYVEFQTGVSKCPLPGSALMRPLDSLRSKLAIGPCRYVASQKKHIYVDHIAVTYIGWFILMGWCRNICFEHKKLRHTMAWNLSNNSADASSQKHQSSHKLQVIHNNLQSRNSKVKLTSCSNQGLQSFSSPPINFKSKPFL